MRLKDFINQDYFGEIKEDIISSKQFLPELIRSFLTFDEIMDSFDESLRERYGQEKMEFRSKMSSIYMSLDLLNFFQSNDYWGLITDKSSFLDFLKEIVENDLKEYSDGFSIEEKRKYNHDYNIFLKLYDECIV